MALSKEEKEALAEHYRNKDIYDPSKAPEQEVTSFTPQAMSDGGMCGYADGGAVGDGIDLGMNYGDLGLNDFAGPAMSADTETAHVPMGLPGKRVDLAAMPQLPPMPAPAALPNSSAPALRGPAPAPQPVLPPAAAITGAPPAEGGYGKLSRGEFDDLIKSLNPTTGQRVGRGVMSGLAGLADAISTGVARTNGSNFQKNIMEMGQNDKQNLINALKQKYESGYKGEELEQSKNRLAEEVRAHGAQEKEATGRLAEEKRAHDLESGQRAGTLNFETGKARVDAAQKIIEAYEKGSGLGSFIGTSVRPSAAEYNAAKNIIKSSGTAAGFAPPPMTATNKQTGQRIASNDGGKTWKPIK